MNKEVEKIMRLLGCTEQEALQVIEDDKKVDKMTMKELNAELTQEQKKIIRSVTQAERKSTNYKFTTRERKENTDKRTLINLLSGTLESAHHDDLDVDNIKVTNVEREIEFTFNSKKYKLTLSAPRS